ncbi:MAG: alpha/beta hydrolase [Candidatus Lokiarchaeota archaeon]|nr:alpha/beta hydrolase [Candidatus Lokiarchaeota archaeon]
MAYEEISKVHKELGKLIEDSFEFRRKVAREFATQKGIPLRDLAAGNVDGKTLLKFNRFLSDNVGEERAKEIPNDVHIERIKIGHIPAEWISVPEVNDNEVYFRLFGGGYMMGTLESRRVISYHISRATHLRCLNIEYRLAPEYPFPAALEDSIESYKWLLSEGFDPKKIIIGGESAGGGLTIATLLKLKEEKLKLPAAGVLMSPWADLTGSGKSIITNQKYEPLIKDGLTGMAKSYAQKESLSNPLISPVFADLKGLPPLLIQVGGIEALLDDSFSLAEQAKTAGIEVDFEIYENMTHVFQNYGEKLSESRKAFESVNQFIQKFF